MSVTKDLALTLTTQDAKKRGWKNEDELRIALDEITKESFTFDRETVKEIFGTLNRLTNAVLQLDRELDRKIKLINTMIELSER